MHARIVCRWLPTLALVWVVGSIAVVPVAGAALGEPRDVAFTATIDGTEQRYVELLPEGFDPDDEHDVLIVLHGHGSDRWQYVREARGECSGARAVAAKHGMIFISPDYRAKTSWMGPKAEADVLQIIDTLRREHRVDRVFLAGGSMGGTAALTFAALHPGAVAGVVSQNGTANLVEFDKFQDAMAESFGGTKQAIPQQYMQRSAEFHADALKMPIAITAGGKDTTVPPQSVLRLVRSLEQRRRPVRVIFRETGGHETDEADTVAAFDFVMTAASRTQQKKPAAVR
ncbi:MAG: alpha/beta hydrolase family protein [Planctomycetia bacterium]